MVAANGSSQNQTKWFYKGADQEIYGPYDGQSMMQWVHSGYFKEALMIRTSNEESFHTLGEWTRICGGKPPFLYGNLYSLEATMYLMAPNPANYPFPPGLAPPQMRLPNGMGHFHMPEFTLGSQPPSEPAENSVVPSPEADTLRTPLTRTIGTDPILPQVHDIGVQTIPSTVTADHAARLLSEIFGQQVEIR